MIVINARFLTQKITGVQRFAIELSKQLKKIMPSVVFVAPGNIIDQELAAELDAQVIGQRTGVIWEQTELPRYLKRNNSPLLLNFCNAAPLYYRNQVVTIHDLAFKINPAWFNKKFVLFYNFLIPRIAKRARMIFTVSEFSKREIIERLGIDQRKVKVVYNSITPFPKRANAEKKYGPYLLGVGSIDKRKNISSLATAFALLEDKSLKLLIAGDVSPIFNNKDNEKLRGLAGVEILGRVADSELAALYAGALAFVYPSLYEGFGIPPLEAMYYDCPTIVSDIESLREVCGQASLFIDPMDPAAIARQIENLLADASLREGLILRGKGNISRFSWAQSAARVAELINHLN